MFKDYDKYLSVSLKVYLFVLIIIFILKLVGLDYFGLDLNNYLMIKLEDLFSNLYVRDVLYLILIITYQYILISMIYNDKSKKLKIFTLFTIPFTYIIQLIKGQLIMYNSLILIIELGYLFLITFIYKFINKNKDSFIKISKRFIIICLFNFVCQLISSITRYQYNNYYVDDFIPNIILNIDYLMLLLIGQNIMLRKEVNFKCIYLEEVGSFSLKKLNLKNLLKKLQKNWHNFKSYDKVTKLTFIIYFIFSLIWNTLSVVLILLVGRLNDTFIECIFILTSFWLSKHSFGKPFHFKSMAQCFIVSNLSYYVLNRVTTPLGISIIVPILLGVGLSYVTSKLVKKVYKPLYRGMPEDLFEETILKVVDKDSLKYKICYDFYMNKKSVISLALKYNYTEAGIRKIKDRVNDKIKRLN